LAAHDDGYGRHRYGDMQESDGYRQDMVAAFMYFAAGQRRLGLRFQGSGVLFDVLLFLLVAVRPGGVLLRLGATLIGG